MAEFGTPLLGSKLVVPPLRLPLVPRPRLLERLQESLNYSFVLISASAGSGKTTLLTDWARHGDPRIATAWLSLNEADNDPVRFWDYVVAALRTLQPAFGESSSAMLHSGQSFPAESLLTVLINELALLSSPFVLVLDDYHLIMAKPIHDGITYLIEHMLAQMHLVMATRVDPPLPLPHFRGRGVMLEIGTDDLRFGRDEAIALLKAMKTAGLSDKDAANLESHTQGWAVGLKMAALAMQRHSDVAAFIANFTGSQRYIMDYLMEEVVLRQPGELQDFLLRTSVLERLSVPLCDAVTGRRDSGDMLLRLEDGNLFTAPLDESRQWYRYDHLFLDLLRHRLEVTFGAGHVAELHRRASQWYEEQGFPDEAIHHALEAQDWETATRLVRRHVTRKIRSGEFATVLSWLQVVPEEVMQRDQGLFRVHGRALAFAGQFDAAERIAGHLELAAKDDGVARGYVAQLRSLIASGRGEPERALEFGKEALALLPADAFDLRSAVSYTLGGIHFMKGRLREAEPLLTEAYEAAQKVGYAVIAPNALGMLASIESAVTGRLRRPLERLQQAIALAGPIPSTAVSHQGVGWLLYELNDLEAAIAHIERAIELSQLSIQPVEGFVARQHALLAHCRLAQGDQAEATREIERAQAIAQDTGRPSARADHAGYHIALALREDDLATALEWGNRLAEDAAARPFYHNHLPARLLIAQGERAAAAEGLQVLYEQSVSRGLQSQVIKVRVCQALAADTTESALRFLADVQAITEPEGYIRTFVDEGRLLAPLLRQAIARGISRDYAARLLSIIEAEDRQRRIRSGQIPAPSATKGLLSVREMEVLRLVAEGLSNQQIADRLTIGLNTAKTHVYRAFGKLDTGDRVQALKRARELKLI